MASFNEDPADRAAELERMLVGHDCTLETAFGFYTLGDCRYTIGDYKGAHEAWKTLHEANVTNALTDQALFQDGRALDASGDLLGAVHAYNSFAARQPEEALVHFNLGEIYGRLGQFSDAAKAYHLAADLDKSEDLQVRRDALFNLGGDQTKQGLYLDAVATLTTLVNMDHGEGFHVLRLAEALKGAGKRDDALREAQRAVALLTKATIDDFDADWENERQTALREASALVGALEVSPAVAAAEASLAEAVVGVAAALPAEASNAG